MIHDIAIVGFGPAGALAASLFGQAGFSVFACDQLHGVHEIPRALALDHEVLRVFQQLGLEDRVAPYCEPFTPSEYYGVDGQLIRRMTMVEPPYPLGYTPSVVFTQPEIERALRECAAVCPNVTLVEGVRCTGLVQDADGVKLSVGETLVRARWVIACDGGASKLRKLLRIGLEDFGFDETWLVVDVLCNERGLAKLPQTSAQYCEPSRPCSFVIGPREHRRWEISLRRGEDPERIATTETTWRLLARWITPEDGTLWRHSTYRFHALVAERWRSGRVFLAGDAAHMQPPFLGQGMCQGVRDVVNLAWKLSAVLRGEVEPAHVDGLLDSYELERKAHARELITRIKAVGSVICERNIARARRRDARLLDACQGVVKDTPRQDLIPPLDRGLLTSTPGAGTLFPQPRLAAPSGSVLMDARHGYGFRLVTDGTLSAPPDFTLRRIDLAHEPETEGVATAWFTRHRVHAALVRPDHYVFGAAADAAGLSALIDAFRATRLDTIRNTAVCTCPHEPRRAQS
ncbi:MAG TPA: bifunctional 3-(3-hydroxy-phenyl)propionate/3-hydroxycinnamic acid hydroxylase [Polyangiales bacterium]|nr:bifunctional 3-(3-hydroxy-phenyl)propionate/3-hydroxycinnamic acid hydroxylase [Polyangiales bacterium]